MEQLAVLMPEEKAGLDADRLAALYARLGAVEGENVLCRAMEELAYRLGHIDRTHSIGDFDEMLKCTKALGAIADQIGMAAVNRIATDVMLCIQDGDPVALAATVSRLARMGERSLYAIWDLQDLSV